MKTKPLAIIVMVTLAAAAGTYGVYRLGVDRGMAMGAGSGSGSGAGSGSGSGSNTSAGSGTAQGVESPAPLPAEDPTRSIAAGEAATRRHIEAGLKAGEIDPATGRPILYYHDPMVPGKRFDAPAKSPFMNMMLVPVYGGDAVDDQGKVTVSPRIQQSLGVRTAMVVEGVPQPQTSAVGSIAWNERDQVVLQARARGFVEKLYVRATLDRVSRGQPIAELVVPDWIAAQEEYLSLKRAPGADAVLVSSARQRMGLVGMTEAQIASVEQAGEVRPRLTLTAPASGVVAELAVREGMTVEPGMLLARINGLATVWAVGELPEAQAALVRPGTQVEARSPGAPGEVFRGAVQAVLPQVESATRTLKARVELANPGLKLLPGMFVTLQFMDTLKEKALLIPTEALIQTGRRSVVLLADEGGRFTPVEVQAGIEAGGQTVIKRGLMAGQRVVVSSQFLIDSEASLRGAEARLNDPAEPDPKPDLVRHRGTGRVEAMDSDGITLTHGPIPSLKWGSMTMAFKPPPTQAMQRGLSIGDHVEFEFVMGADGPQITGLKAMPPVSVKAPAAATDRLTPTPTPTPPTAGAAR